MASAGTQAYKVVCSGAKSQNAAGSKFPIRIRGQGSKSPKSSSSSSSSSSSKACARDTITLDGFREYTRNIVTRISLLCNCLTCALKQCGGSEWGPQQLILMPQRGSRQWWIRRMIACCRTTVQYVLLVNSMVYSLWRQLTLPLLWKMLRSDHRRMTSGSA